MTAHDAVDRDAGTTPLLDVRDLRVEFPRGRGLAPLRAVDGVSFTVAPRETVGVVGESGSGKSTIGRAILGLTSATGGTVGFAGEDITYARPRRRRELSAELQVVFQDPYSSLNPTRTIGQTLGETLSVHGRPSRTEVDERVHAMLARVGLGADAANRYPGSFSGGQRQRIAIARALMVRPRLVICDEAVSALDVSVQANVLNLLRELQEDFELGYVFIAHDLDVVRHLSHRTVVLYRGRIMEQGDAATVYADPAHPYTQALIDAVPVPVPELQRERRAARRLRLADTADTIGTASAAPTADACPFAARCPHAVDLCRTQRPPLERVDNGSTVACHRWRELRAATPARSDSVTR
jgi:oligopeptide/dipeptide ABC transporter ATP-binding protein